MRFVVVVVVVSLSLSLFAFEADFCCVCVDYAKTQKALDSCWFCHQEDEDPKVPIVAMGTRAYLALNRFEGLSDAHCLIVPISHHLASLEADEDTWEEIKVSHPLLHSLQKPILTVWMGQNFMKTLMQMAGQNDHGVIFFETATNLKSQKHTYIEAIPVPWKVYEDAPGYFKESILMAESEWSQNKRLIDFSQRPGGFRRSMVPNLPYFAVQFDYKGLFDALNFFEKEKMLMIESRSRGLWAHH